MLARKILNICLPSPRIPHPPFTHLTISSLSATITALDARRREVFYYQTPAGKVVVRDWIESLADGKARAIIRLRLGRIEEGNLGDHRAVSGGIMELRLRFGPGYRVYFAFDGPIIVILLCGGTKKTQAADIRIARQYWKTYKEGGE